MQLNKIKDHCYNIYKNAFYKDTLQLCWMGFNYKSNLNGFAMILKKKINSVKELKYKKKKYHVFML